MTNHTYFNLYGVSESVSDIKDHRLRVFSDAYLPTDGNHLVTGGIRSVVGTPLDLRTGAKVGGRLSQLLPALGYDVHFCDEETSTPKPLAELSCDETRYKADRFVNAHWRTGLHSSVHGQIWLETQHYLDAVNHPEFPSICLDPGEEYKHYVVWHFETM